MLDPADLHWEVLRETYRQIVLFVDLKKKQDVDKKYAIANLKGLILMNTKALNKPKASFELDQNSKDCLEKALKTSDSDVIKELAHNKNVFKESKIFKPIINDIHKKLIGQDDIDLKKQMAKVEVELIGTDITELFNKISQQKGQ